METVIDADDDGWEREWCKNTMDAEKSWDEGCISP